MSERDLVQSQVDQLLAEHDPASVDPVTFFAAQFDAGLAYVHLPPELGGLGVDRKLQRLVDEGLRAASAKSAALRNPIGVGMGIPTLERHAPELLARYARAAFIGDEIWCQLFSEPGSGSDLAGLAARAKRDGDSWIVNGQKVWTSMAHVASIGMLLVRTDPDVPKHQGLTFFLVDMHAPGIEVRPLRQMTGDAEFNEVFLSDVRVPDSSRVGALGDGWCVAATTLGSERGVLGANTVGGSGADRLLATIRASGGVDDPVLRQELARRYSESRVIGWTRSRARAATADGGPSPHGSIGKLLQTLHNQRLQETALRLHGLDAVAWRPDDDVAPAIARGFLRAQGNTIEGGTSNIQRNILGEQVLGLPREPRSDTRAPWSALARNG